MPRSQTTPVAQYLRASTEHQRYSTLNQRKALEKYAEEQGMQVTRTYEDSGKSGLTLAGRPALQKLLEDALNPYREFEAVLVYDVSRWGRFQDVDESAYYEYVCKRAGVQVHYCAEAFGDVSGPMSIIIKSVKRAMAAEYSRELGNKVHMGKRTLAQRGFVQGGVAPYGLRRIAISEDGKTKGELKPHDRKFLQTDRVLLEPGDLSDVLVVRAIFDLCARLGLREAEIAQRLNWSCWPRPRKPLLPWDRSAVRRLIRSECYAGTLVWNRKSCRLRTHWVRNPKEEWVRTEHCFDGLVSQKTFDDAQLVLKKGHRHYWKDDEMLDIVRRAYAKHGTITPWLVRFPDRMHPRVPDATLYTRHFGSLADACEVAGIKPTPHLITLRDRSNRRRNNKIELLRALAEKFRARNTQVIWAPRTRLALVGDRLLISMRVSQPYRLTQHKSKFYWYIRGDFRLRPNTSVIARLAPHSENEFLDFFILPFTENRRGYLGNDGHATSDWLDQYRLATFDDVIQRLSLLIPGATVPTSLPRNLAKRRRVILHIKRSEDPYYLTRPPRALRGRARHTYHA